MFHGHPGRTRYYIVVRGGRTTRCRACAALIAIVIAWGACPWTLIAQTTRVGRVEDPFRRFREAPPEPAPLMPNELAWTLTLPAAPSAPAAMDSVRVYVPLQDARLIAIERDTGLLTWTRRLHSLFTPLVTGDHILVLQGAALRVLDAATGEDRGGAVFDAPLIAPLRLAGPLLLATLAPGDIVALDAMTLRELWRHSLGSPPPHPPSTHGLTAYVVSADSRLLALSLTDGRLLWEHVLPGILSEPVAIAERVYVGSTDNHLYAFDPESGALRWKMVGGGDVIGAAADAGRIFYVSLDNIVRALNQGNGNQRWREDAGTRPIAPPMAFGDLVIVPGVAPAVRVFNGRTGVAIGSIAPAQGTPFGAPLIDRTLPAFRPSLFLLTLEGTLEAHRAAPMMFRELAPAATALPGRVVPREVLR
jgi:hypothetical protein